MPCRARWRAEPVPADDTLASPLNINDPAWRIAAVTGEEPDTIVWQFVRLIEAGYDTNEIVVLVDRTIQAGHTIEQLATGLLGPDTQPPTPGASDA